MSTILGVIPSRYASTRFPGKPLVKIGDKTMVQRVYEQATQCPALRKVVVATDDARIFDHVLGFGGHACMTSADHQSGTDRCFEVVCKEAESFDYVVNIQGDEPFISPIQIGQLTDLLDGHVELATQIRQIDELETLFNPNVVKAITDIEGKALYFSRHPIPYIRGKQENTWLLHQKFYQHIGIYAYRADVLGKITQLPISALEKSESLEQLRWLENGFAIKTSVTHFVNIGIDTPEDLEKVKGLI